METSYKFRDELLQIHSADIRDASRKTKDNEYALPLRTLGGRAKIYQRKHK